jgi:mono/diheme cytochrome c family protein
VTNDYDHTKKSLASVLLAPNTPYPIVTQLSKGPKQMRMRLPLLIISLAFLTWLGTRVSATVPEPVVNSNPRSAPRLYAKYCISCHGRDGRAKTRKARYNHARDISESKWQDDVSDERIFNSIMNGRNVRGEMPAFSKQITDQEAEALVNYVRGLRK